VSFATVYHYPNSGAKIGLAFSWPLLLSFATPVLQSKVYCKLIVFFDMLGVTMWYNANAS